jgi:hypothetical protein
MADELEELRERLRIAEAVRDDAREASARDLERRRAAEQKYKELKSWSWAIIANAYYGDWSTAHESWRTAAEKWRDEYCVPDD